jgi:dTDP-4-amino-4,6-dideoxygalactose transaminase
MLELQIPFNQSSLLGPELEHIYRTMTIGQIAGDQTFSRKHQALLEQVLAVKRALVTTSCTHALEMAALLLDIQPGDEVIVPSFSLSFRPPMHLRYGARGSCLPTFGRTP